ncbi:hypothetical protein FOA52_010857 [Chlamydomonas sp. UWO 241]|nr:hypothetical protein FOA52_010857 [Chlamydomonas sp. UWO 241]
MASDRSSLKRLQQLDKAFFPPSSGRRAFEGDDGSLPPIILRPATQHEPHGTGQLYGSKTGRPGLHSSPGPLLRATAQSAALATSLPSSPARRRPNVGSLTYGTNPSNPFEAVVEARAPARLAQLRDARGTELVLPGGVSRDSLCLLEIDLEAYVAGDLHAARSAAHPAAAGADFGIYSPPGSPTPRHHSPRLLCVPLPGAGGLGGGQQQPPWQASVLDLRSSAAHQRPPTWHDWGAGGLPASPNVYNSSPRLDSAVGGGLSICASVNLGNFIGEVGSSRREVQAMAEWLDDAVARAWGAHAAGLAEEAARAEMRGGGGGDPAEGAALSSSQPGGQPQAQAQAQAQAQQGPVSRALWGSMLQAVSACAGALASRLSGGCTEEGALFARLWNLQTSLLDAELGAAHADARACASQAHVLSEKVRRLEPLVDWEREASAEITELRGRLTAETNALALARAERDGLLRENDKIILHYRKELKTLNQQAHKDAFKLARKIKIMQSQLKVMDTDRSQMAGAIASTKVTTAELQLTTTGLQRTVGELSGTVAADSHASVVLTGSGLSQIQAELGKLLNANLVAEDAHFSKEEEATIYAAADDVDDSFVDAVLAEGDPENGGKLLVLAGAVKPVEEDVLDEDVEDEEEEDEDFYSASVRTRSGALDGEDGVEGEGSGAAAREPSGDADADDAEAEAVAAAEAATAEEEAAEQAAAEAAAAAALAADADAAAAVAEAEAAEAARLASLAEVECQTGEELLEGVREEAGAKAHLAAAQQVAYAFASAGLDVGISGNELSATAAMGNSPVQAVVDAALAKLHMLQAVVQAKMAEVATMTAAQGDSSARVVVLAREAEAARADAAAVQSVLTQLRERLSRAGVDPENPAPPTAPAAVVKHAPVAEDVSPQLCSACRAAAAGDNAGKAAPKAAKAAPVKPPPVFVRPTLPVAAAPTDSRSASPTRMGAAGAGGRKSPTRSSPASPKKGHARAYRKMESRRHDLPGGLRLADAILRHEDAKPRTLDWVLKLIDGVYRGKATNDEQRARSGQPPMPLADYLFQHLAGVYGTRDLVNQYAAQVVATLTAYKREDARLATFQKFLDETWSVRELVIYIEGMKKLAEPARLPCADYPSDFLTHKGAAPVADVRKCLWVADKVLMKRHTKTAYAFAAALSAKAEPTPDAELQQFFSAPGYYGPDVAAMKAYERGRAEFRRLPAHTFLEALCEEYRRCEKVLFDMLPQVFQRWDTDGDGLMVRADVSAMVSHMMPRDTAPEAVGAEVEALWSAMVAAEVGVATPVLSSVSVFFTDAPPGSRSQSSVIQRISGLQLSTSPTPGALPPLPNNNAATTLVGCSAFLEAAPRCEPLRAYVRLFKTPPARSRTHTNAEEQTRLLLLILISRHWRAHGPYLASQFGEMGALQAKVAEQADAMDKEEDGMRKALLLHGLLKTMINRQLDKLVDQISSGRGAPAGWGGVDPGFESSLARLTSATKVLYGSPAIVLEDFDDAALLGWEGASPMAQDAMQAKLANAMALFTQARSKMDGVATIYLGRHAGVKAFIRRWRARVAARTGAGAADQEEPDGRPRSATAVVEEGGGEEDGEGKGGEGEVGVQGEEEGPWPL